MMKMFKVHFLDVEYGDATILQFENGRTYLVDSNEVSGKVTPYEYLTQTVLVRLMVDTIDSPAKSHRMPRRKPVLGRTG